MLAVHRRATISTTVVLAIWCACVALAVVWGRVLVAHGTDLVLAAPPFWSPAQLHGGVRIVPAVLLAAAVVAYAPTVVSGASWLGVLTATAVTSVSWAVALAMVDTMNGIDALTDPLTLHRNDYLQTARTIHSLPGFLGHFVDNIATYPQHSMGHPPGMIVVQWALDHVGLAGATPNAVLALAGGAAAALAALVAARAVAGETVARAAAPFLVLVPAVIWWQSADAIYAGVSAWAVTLVVLATGRRDRRGDAYAAAGGVLFGVTAFFSYGLVLLACIPVIVAVRRGVRRPLAVAAIGALAVFATFAAAGFSWFAGLLATRRQYWAGAAATRPYSYFLFADLVVLAVACGPAVAIALTSVRRTAPALWALVGGAVVVVALADLSGMSKAEVERIWLPFVPWLVLACGAFAARSRRDVRALLALQAACAIGVVVTVWSWW